MVTAIAMVRDEADIVEATVRNMIAQADHVIVADNGSRDGTTEILKSLPIEYLEDADPAYYQSEKMTALAERARANGADWVVPFDADEVWLATSGHRIADILTALPAEALIAEAVLYDHVATGIDENEEQGPVRSMVWRREAIGRLRKVACRTSPGLTIRQGNHSAKYAGEPYPLTVTGEFEIRHFPYRSVRQFITKARNGAEAYAATDLPETVGGHWRGYGQLLAEHGEAALAQHFHRWFYRGDPTIPIEIAGEQQGPLVRDPAPCMSN